MTPSEAVNEHILVVTQLLRDCMEDVERVGEKLAGFAQERGMLFFFGNGGSAAMAQHLAAEFSKVRAIALADPASLTAISNDVSFDYVFSQRIATLGRAADVAIGMSTSGVSRNIVWGLRAAKQKGMYTVALTGASPNPAAETADDRVCIPSRSTARIQEAHLLIGHLWCQRIEEACG